MSLVKRATSLLRGGETNEVPIGTIQVADASPLNWLHVLQNVAEELVRVNTHGHIVPAAMRAFNWTDNRTLEIQLREDERFPDREAVTAETVKRSIDEGFRWSAPHPPGTHFNIDRRTRVEAVDERTIRLHLPGPDGLLLGKLHAYHVMSTRFWQELGFGYARTGTGEGHW